MSSLTGTLSIGLGALMAQQAALETTAGNIANINTEGYVRRQPLMVEEEPVSYGSSIRFGAGISFEGVRSIRDQVLELQITATKSDYASHSSLAGAMQAIENRFSNSQSGIGAALSEFFNSLTALTATPQELPARQRVLVAAEDVATNFRETSAAMADAQQQVDLSIVAAVQDVNELSRQIAALNADVVKRELLGQDTGTYEDRRTTLVKQLASLVGIAVTKGDDGITVTAGNGTALVVGSHSFALEIGTDSVTALQQIYDATGNVTARLSGGRIGGLLQARDAVMPELRANLDQLASGIATAINMAHRAGTDLAGAMGQDLFVLPAVADGTATTLRVSVTDPRLVAAGTDGEAGSSGNLANLLAVSSSAIVSGRTPIDAYANLVYRIGNLISSAEAESEAAATSLKSLEDQRGAISGVSLDEEAANLIRFQRAYQAAARVISVVDEMTQVAINLGRN